MTPTAPARPPVRLAAEVAGPLSLSDAAKERLTATATPRQYLDTLVAVPLPEDALRFLAAALPKRECVWWGCVCLNERLAKPLPEAAAKALATAAKWVKDPSEANRRMAEAAANAVGYGTAAGSLAAAAFWSGGSLAPPDLPAVPPRDDLTGQAVAGAVLIAAAADPLTIPTAYQRFLAIGFDIAAGKQRWT